MVKIYILKDPRYTDIKSIRYVGKTANKKPEARLKAHINEKGDTRKVRWLQELKRLNLLPVMELIEEVDDSLWVEAERRNIKHYRDLGCDLTNLTDGGDGVHNPSEESRKKLSESRKKMWADPGLRVKLLKGVKSDSRCKSISASLTGKRKSAEHISKLPQNQKGSRRNLTVEQRHKIGEFFRKYNSERQYGPTPEDVKQKISTKLKGRKSSNAGKPKTSESNEKRRVALLGKSKSAEHREKQRLAALKRWEHTRRSKNDNPEPDKVSEQQGNIADESDPRIQSSTE